MVYCHRWYLRDSYFSDVANNLLADHDNRQLYAQINHAARSPTAVQTKPTLAPVLDVLASQTPIVTRRPDDQIQLEEGNVEDGRVSVHELEQEHLVGKTVLVVGLCSRVFPIGQPYCQLLIEELQ